MQYSYLATVFTLACTIMIQFSAMKGWVKAALLSSRPHEPIYLNPKK